MVHVVPHVLVSKLVPCELLEVESPNDRHDGLCGVTVLGAAFCGMWICLLEGYVLYGVVKTLVVIEGGYKANNGKTSTQF